MKRQRFVRKALCVLGGLVLAACTHYSLVSPEQVTMGDAYTVTPVLTWNKAEEGKTTIWTADGQMLQEIRFVNGLEDGDPLFEPTGFESDEKKPRYKSGMTPLEVREFLEASIVQADVIGAKYSGFRPFKFGSASGFRLEFSYNSKDGLIKEGFVVGTIKGEKLYLIIYHGAKMYYFAKYKANVEALIQTIQFK